MTIPTSQTDPQAPTSMDVTVVYVKLATLETLIKGVGASMARLELNDRDGRIAVDDLDARTRALETGLEAVKVKVQAIIAVAAGVGSVFGTIAGAVIGYFMQGGSLFGS